jgi:hypothetical protein
MKVTNQRTKFKRFASLIIDKLIAEGHKFITLRQLYSECGAVAEIEKNGVQWARQRAIDDGKVRKMEGYSGVYQVVR